MPCVHSLCVSNSFPFSWSGLSHNDVSVVWLKSYYLYSIQKDIIPDAEKQQKIKDVYHTLRGKEDVGLTIPIDIFNQIKTPIVLISDYPQYFIGIRIVVTSNHVLRDINKILRIV